jgi:chromate transporter
VAESPIADPRAGAWRLFRIWAIIGLQSFGGGASTTFLIQRTFIEKYGWLSMEEFLHLWNLCLLTPGINLVALTALLGKRFGGVGGIFAALAGLLLPSAAITCLLAALFQQIEQSAAVQAVLRGVIPATGGIMLLVGVNFARPLISKGYKAGWLFLLAGAVIVLACACAVIFLQISVVIVILSAVLLGALFFSPEPPAPVIPEAQEQEERSGHD